MTSPVRLFRTVLLLAMTSRCYVTLAADLLSDDDLENPPTTKEYCEGEVFHAQCTEDEVVVMYTARYGRMAVGKCLTRQVGAMGCNANVLSLLDRLCSGQHQCQVRVSSIIDSIPEERQPCSKDFRSYLEASYICVKTIRRPPDACIGQKQMKVTEPSGYLASIVTDETTCGSIDAPWILTMSGGQTVDVELYDFAVSTREGADYVDDVSGVCHVYAIIKEKAGKSSETICGSHVRRSVAFQSTGNVLEIRLVTKRKSAENGYFLLKYRAKGCPDPPAPTNGWMQRSGNQAVLGCNSTSDQWLLICEGDTWRGKTYNCSQGGVSGHLEKAIIGLFSGSQWASIVIILAIAVTLGLVIFLIGLVVLRRRCALRGRRPSVYRNQPVPPELYAPQYRDSESVSYGTKPLAAMDCSGSENDYYRTWQLQRHPPGGRHYPGAHGSYGSAGNDDPLERAGMICTNPHCVQRPYDSMDAERRQPVEHIYESPKFDRKDAAPPPPPPAAAAAAAQPPAPNPAPPAPNPAQNAVASSTTAGGSSTQYFELDPEHV